VQERVTSKDLFILELHCEAKKPNQGELNPEAREFRPKRSAAVAALRSIHQMQET
jgi:hypothetical protein